MQTRALTAALVLAGALAAGCGSQTVAPTADDGEPAPGTPSGAPATTPPTPQCDEVWVTGATLPTGYQRCYDGGAEVATDGSYCEFGKPLLTHDDRFWAVRGGTVQETTTDGELVDDPGYREDLRLCRG